LYQRRAVLVRREIRLLGQWPATATDDSCAAVNADCTDDSTILVVVMVVPVRRPTVPVLQLLVVLVRRRRTMMVPGRRTDHGVIPATRRFKLGIVPAAAAVVRRRRFDQTVARVTIDG